MTRLATALILPGSLVVGCSTMEVAIDYSRLVTLGAAVGFPVGNTPRQGQIR